ncbi:MAG: ParA family protein [Gammaproteobacteria bacterium]|nr:ParA family protein [Gammaproteobacteria bacterium]
MRVIAVINQKGGVAKTTTTANLGHALAMNGERVTLLDLDPQGHLGIYMGVHDRKSPGIEQVLLDDMSLNEVILNVRDNIMLVPAGARLDRIEQLTTERMIITKRLKTAIEILQNKTDYLLIDCPPSSGLLVILALYSCHEVLIPVNGDYLSLQGVSHFLGNLKNIENILARHINFQLVLTRFHPRRRLARSIIEKLLEYFPGKILATPIRSAAALAEAPSFGKTIFEYAPRSSASDDYSALAKDLEYGRVM